MNDRPYDDPNEAYNERVVAFILDWLVLDGLVFAAAGGGGAGVLAAIAVSLVNQGIATGLTGYSLGKAMTGVRVARVDQSERPGIVAGLLRWLLLWVLDAPILWLVGLISSSRTDRRQRIGDLVAKTWVIGLAPPSRARTLASLGYAALCLVLLFVFSSAAGFAVSGIFLPVAVGAAVIVAGVARRRAPWPWLVGLGIALIPASYMAAVKLCDNIAGACISGDALTTSKQAIVSVVAFLVAAGLLVVPRSRARDVAFQVLVLFGQVWLLLKLIDSHERPEMVMVIALIVLELGYEVATRVRAARDRAAVQSPAALA
jgi:uncharacterized RDD family membrane protein YckC